MATRDTAKDAVYNRFTTQWAAASRSEPVMHENDATDPLDPDFNAAGGGWVRLMVQERAGGQVSLGPIGDRKFERRGAIMAQCFVEADTGTETLDAMVETVRDIFEGVSFSGVNGFEAVTRPLESDGRWYGKLVECEYRYEETK